MGSTQPPSRRPRRPELLQAGLALAAALLSGSARAELPPWVYGEQQRQAPLVVQLAIDTVELDAGGFRVEARVLAIRRQRRSEAGAGPAVRVGSRLLLRLPPLPQARPGPPLAGPSPLPPPAAGQRLTAWLEPSPGGGLPWRPAAGGRSFGPSLERFQDPNTP